MGYYFWGCIANIHTNYSPDSVAYVAEQYGRVGDDQPQSSGYVQMPALSVAGSRTGYTLKGYSQNRNATSADLNPGDTLWWTDVGFWNHTFTVYCIWQIDTYTVSYNANGGTGAPSAQTKTYGTNLTLSSTVPTRTNYTFLGWATSSAGSVAYQPGGTYSANAGVTLYAIWAVAAATLNRVDNVTIGTSGGTGVASWTIAKSSHKYWLKFVLSGASDAYYPSGTTYVSPGTSSVTFTIPSHWLNALSGSTSATATAILYSFDGDTFVGTTQKTFTVSVASSVKPSISSFTSAPHSNNATVEGWGVVVQGYSYLTLSVSATAGMGASISNISFSGHGISQSSTSTSGNTAVVTSTGSLTYTVTVKDSRGRTASTTLTVTSYAYSNPEVSSLTAVRCLSDGTQSDTEGGYLKAYPVFVFSSVNGNNSLTVKKIEYKQHDSSTWTEVTAAAVSGSWTSVFGPADITKTFDVRCTVTDAVGNTYVLSVSVPPVVGFSLGLKNDRARFGGPVEKAGLQVDWPTEFNSTVDVTNRRASASLSSAGWYRVMKLTYANAAYVRGAMGAEIVFHITRRLSNAGEEAHEIRMMCNDNNITFTNEVSHSRTQRIDKIRYTYVASTCAYVDIHCSDACPNTTVDFEVYVDKDRRSFYTAESLQSVADAPTGETVLATYSFAEECTPEARVLLWNNWNTNDVNPQTISMDLSGYKFIEVIFDPFSALGKIQCQRCLVGPSSSTSYSATLQYYYLKTDATGTASLTAVSRDIDVYSSGIVIGNGQMLYNNTKYNDWPSRCRPIQIWGIR